MGSSAGQKSITPAGSRTGIGLPILLRQPVIEAVVELLIRRPEFDDIFGHLFRCLLLDQDARPEVGDVPMDPVELELDLDLFRKMAPLVKPKLVTLGLSMTLFPFPIQAMSEIVTEGGGHIFFDGAHQLAQVKKADRLM